TATIINGALSVEDDGAVANGVATNSVKAIVTDAYGNRVPNLSVDFSTDNDGVIAASSTTDANGLITLTLTNTKSGVTQVTATVNNHSQTVDSTFIPDTTTAKVSLEVVTGNMPADGAAQNSIKAKVVDAFGNLIPNQLVNFSATNSATIAASGTTGSNGEVIMTLINTNPGDSEITATLDGSNDSDTVTFLPVPFSVKFTLSI
ncbi:TPA: Ig-like domain-containing protein, partial [Yersinia enterocolitica]